MPLFCDYNSLVTESDVEQKLIYPFLTSDSPIGLGLDDSQVLTKHVLRQVLIGKGQKQKYYYPDYLVSIRGIPVLVLEAKKPSEPLEDAYAEARLYAEEVNAKFPHNINTCQMVIVCNGSETWAGFSDSANPVVKLSFDDFCVGNTHYTQLVELCSKKRLEDIANKPYLSARGNAKFHTPVSTLGGKRVQNEELEENSFGRTFIFENRRIFDPETEADREVIVENAYVPSAKRVVSRNFRKMVCRAWHERSQPAMEASSRLFQIMCKPPEWCKIEASHRRFYYGQKESHAGRKGPAGENPRTAADGEYRQHG